MILMKKKIVLVIIVDLWVTVITWNKKEKVKFLLGNLVVMDNNNKLWQ